MEIAIQAMLAPVILSIGSLILMMQIAFWRHSNTSWFITCGVLVTALLSLSPSSQVVPQIITLLLISDHYSIFF